MYEHARNSITGNKGMEVAAYPTYIHDSTCLLFSVARLSGFVVINDRKIERLLQQGLVALLILTGAKNNIV